MTPAGLHVAHAIPGRVRLKVDALRGNPSLANEVAKTIEAIRGVREVEVNPVTGSLLVHHDDDPTASSDTWHGIARTLAGKPIGLDAHEIATHLTTHARPHHQHRARQVRQAFQDLNQRVAHTTGGLDLALLVPLVLVALGVRGLIFAEKAVVPRWYDFLWFGFGTFMMLNAAGVSPARAAEEAVELTAGL